MTTTMLLHWSVGPYRSSALQYHVLCLHVLALALDPMSRPVWIGSWEQNPRGIRALSYGQWYQEPTIFCAFQTSRQTGTRNLETSQRQRLMFVIWFWYGKRVLFNVWGEATLRWREQRLVCEEQGGVGKMSDPGWWGLPLSLCVSMGVERKCMW